MSDKTSFLRRRRLAIGASALVVAVAAAALLYGKSTDGDRQARSCAASDAAIARAAPLEKGEVAAALSPRRAAPLPDLVFQRPDGTAISLETFRGRVVLLNLWASWCVPCREEMPTLDRLQGELGSPDFEVVAVNIDTSRREKARDFWREIGVEKLAFYADPKADVFYRLKTAGKALGLPTSILIGRDGCEIATLAGPANWASEEAKALARAAF